jgi:lipoprotein-anchoring transpeptidase ErfK/SrfK
MIGDGIMKSIPLGLAALFLSATIGATTVAPVQASTQPTSQSEAKKKTKKPAAEARKKECDTLFQCMFGKKRSATSSASLFSGGSGLSGGTTRETVSWSESKYKAGSIIVRTPERALYYVLGNGKAVRYKVGVGREGFQWSGSSRIVNKAEWPDWRPPQRMIEREAAKGNIIPPFMEGGPNNPLGARALYIGGTIFRIHGTNNARSIGGAVSSGCIRMMNKDVIDLYERVNVGARVYVYQ